MLLGGKMSNNAKGYLEEALHKLQKASMLAKPQEAENLIKRVINIVVHQEKSILHLNQEIERLKNDRKTSDL